MEPVRSFCEFWVIKIQDKKRIGIQQVAELGHEEDLPGSLSGVYHKCLDLSGSSGLCRLLETQG